MFDLVREAPEAMPVFAAARQALDGRDPRDLVAQAGAGDLHANRTAQILCCTQALAYWAVLGPAAPRPVTVAGYSAGELAAWGVAGIIDAGSVLDLTSRRAAWMDAAAGTGSGMAAVLGLPRPAIDAICQAHDLHISIINGPLHVILGGRITDLTPALAQAEAQGAVRTVLLPVALAAHTPALREARERFGDLLRQRIAATRVPLEVRLISGIDGEPVLRVPDGLRKLAAQIEQTVDWAACMDACAAVRPQRVLELGPGDALARMFREVAPEIPARRVTAFRSLDGLRHWLQSEA